MTVSPNTAKVLKTIGLAMLLPVLYAIQDSVRDGVLKLDWPVLGTLAVLGAVAQIIKILTPKISEEPKTTTFTNKTY